MSGLDFHNWFQMDKPESIAKVPNLLLGMLYVACGSLRTVRAQLNQTVPWQPILPICYWKCHINWLKAIHTYKHIYIYPLESREIYSGLATYHNTQINFSQPEMTASKWSHASQNHACSLHVWSDCCGDNYPPFKLSLIESKLITQEFLNYPFLF